MVEKLFPVSFIKNQNSLKFYAVVNVLGQVVGYRNMLKLSYRPVRFTSYKVLENKKRSGTSLPDSFSVRFLKKNISLVKFY